MIKVIKCEPGKKAYIKEINTDLNSLQEEVGGFIETFYPFMDDAYCVCNDEGKINGMEPCRAIEDDKGNVLDIICGPFFICMDNYTDDGPEFGSLSDELLKKYLNKFLLPEHYFRYGPHGAIHAAKYKPNEA